ncbi:hypothetical protein [Providencia stuartii]|uniref:hypothetical protein n=1 Tax=Providencia stuartii TaxID=588 RepID=UPI0024C72E2F|nr:hypothetical protein [Providencia stuartii]WAZ77939.1 hypothetical protein O4001_17235 [Providencia stuartii]WAZ80922.1 hypothetical protein O4002_10780 [Providencia stuartii]
MRYRYTMIFSGFSLLLLTLKQSDLFRLANILFPRETDFTLLLSLVAHLPVLSGSFNIAYLDVPLTSFELLQA